MKCQSQILAVKSLKSLARCGRIEKSLNVVRGSGFMVYRHRAMVLSYSFIYLGWSNRTEHIEGKMIGDWKKSLD